MKGMIAAMALLAGQSASDEERREGFMPMFDGTTFAGWQFGGGYALPDPPSNWSVRDGVIAVAGGGGPHLGSQWDYEDFEIRFEWRGLRDRYNSGFFIRSGRKVGANQINLARGGEGRFMGGKMKGGPAVPELQKPPGEWNEWRARVEGDKVTFSCNGKPAWEGTEFQTKRGYVGLQAEGAPLEFRNLRIREIGWELLEETPGSGARWTKDAGDFALRLEWKSEKGATGRIGLRGAAVTLGDAGGSGGIAGVAPPSKSTDNPPGQWNYLEVRMAGRRVTVWQNGEEVMKDRELEVPAAGPLAVVPSAEGFRVRNARVRTAAR